MTDLDVKQVRITFRDAFFYIVRKWRTVVVVVLACAIFAGLFRAISLIAMIKSDSYQASAMELYEQAVEFRESELERLDKEIKTQEKWLENRNRYLKESYLMTMNPDTCSIGSADIQITCDSVSGQISIITGVLQFSFSSGKIGKIIAEKLGTEPNYIQEIIRVDLMREEKQTSKLEENEGNMGINAVDGALFHVGLIAQDENMAHEMLSAIIDSFNKTCEQMNGEQENICVKLMYYNENYLNRREDQLEYYQQSIKDEKCNVEEYLKNICCFGEKNS